MRGRIFIFLLFVCSANHYSFAAQSNVCEQSEVICVSDSAPQFVEPTSTRDTLFTNDSIIVIHTVCAPICSSRARVYNKEWKEIGILRAPFTSIFPEAYIEDGKVLWRDNDTFDYSPVP